MDDTWFESPERADELRVWLSERGIPFEEELPANCGGAVYSLFHFAADLDLARLRQAWERGDPPSTKDTP